MASVRRKTIAGRTRSQDNYSAFTQLETAAITGNRREVKRLIRAGTRVNCRSSLGTTVLHHVARCTDTDMMEYLVGLGADVNARDAQHCTPLHYALISTKVLSPLFEKFLSMYPDIKNDVSLKEFVEMSKVKAIDTLVGMGADVNAKFKSSGTSLQEAIRRQIPEAVEMLSRLGLAAENAPSWYGSTAVTLAIDEDEHQVLDRLVHHGAVVNTRCMSQLYPLHSSVMLGRNDFVKILLDHGADSNSRMAFRVSPVVYTLMTKPIRQQTILKRLKELGANFDSQFCRSNAISQAIRLKRRPELVNLLIRYGGDINEYFQTLSPLGWATVRCENDTCMMEYLLEQCNVDINAKSSRIPSIAEAVKMGDVEMVRELIEHGADPSTIWDPVGLPPVYLFTNWCLKEDGNTTMKLLLRHGASVNLASDDISLLRYAVIHGDVNMVKELVHCGADVNVGTYEGKTLLVELLVSSQSADDTQIVTHWRVDITLIQALLEAGADVNTAMTMMSPVFDAVRLSNRKMLAALVRHRDDVNREAPVTSRPLDIAIESDRKDIVELLVRNGADINGSYRIGRTPLHYAVEVMGVESMSWLMAAGAHSGRAMFDGITGLQRAIYSEDCEMLKLLVGLGADITVNKVSTTSAFHHYLLTLYELGVLNSMDVIDFIENGVNLTEEADRTFLHAALETGNLQLVETVLSLDSSQINQDLYTHRPIKPLVQFLNQLRMIVSDGPGARNITKLENIYCPKPGLTPLQYVCFHGMIDVVRLFLCCGADVRKLDSSGRRPLDRLPLSSVADYHVLYETYDTEEVVTPVSPDCVLGVASCPGLESILQIPGTGDVASIPDRTSTTIMGQAKEFLALGLERCTDVSQSIVACGSSAEGTKVGFPDEMDFLVVVETLPLQEVAMLVQKSYGCLEIPGRISKRFHSVFAQSMIDIIAHLSCINSETFSSAGGISHDIQDRRRRATSPIQLFWKDGHTSRLRVSVDLVPCIHIPSWPADAITESWLLDNQALRSHGYYLVAKPPHKECTIAKEFTDVELRSLWKTSFAHLETYHMQHLEKRVKDVYLLAKCLRNPDVSRLMVTDEQSLPKSTDRYISSYMLKMVFFQNVDYFLQSDLSLGEMVCKVYDDLEEGLRQGFIPIYFSPTVNALDGHKLDVTKCLKVATILRRFVWELYRRDSRRLHECDVVEHVTKPRSVYRSIELSEIDL